MAEIIEMARSDCDSMSRAAAPSPRRNQISTSVSKIIEPPAPQLPDISGHILQIGPVSPHSERRMGDQAPFWFFYCNRREARLFLTPIKHCHGLAAINRLQHVLHAVTEIHNAGFHVYSLIYSILECPAYEYATDSPPGRPTLQAAVGPNSHAERQNRLVPRRLPVRPPYSAPDDCRRLRRCHDRGALGPGGKGRAGGAGRPVSECPRRIRGHRVRHQYGLHRRGIAALCAQRRRPAGGAPPDRHPGAGLDFRVRPLPGPFHRHVRVWRGRLLAGRSAGPAPPPPAALVGPVLFLCFGPFRGLSPGFVVLGRGGFWGGPAAGPAAAD